MSENTRAYNISIDGHLVQSTPASRGGLTISNFPLMTHYGFIKTFVFILVPSSTFEQIMFLISS